MIKAAGNPNNPIIVFLHGFMGSKEDWDVIISELKNDYFCLALDLPGHGEQELPNKKDQNFEDVIEKLFIKLNELARPYHIVGYSMGARLALGLAINHPEAILSLTLESGNPGLPENEKRERLKKDEHLFDAVHSQSDLKKFLEVWYSSPLFQKLDSQELIVSKSQGNYQSWADALGFLSIGAQPSYWSKLSKYPGPLCYICGQEDFKYLNIGKSLEEVDSRVTLQVLENCSHVPHLERPALFLLKLREFIAKYQM